MITNSLKCKLFKKYPKLFDKDNCLGINCGKGWYSLIDTLCNTIQIHVNSNVYLVELPFKIMLIKEKFGSLCIYKCGGNDFISGMVSLAEYFSLHICEYCGSLENVARCISKKDSHMKSLCKKCKEKNDFI